MEEFTQEYMQREKDGRHKLFLRQIILLRSYQEVKKKGKTQTLETNFLQIHTTRAEGGGIRIDIVSESTFKSSFLCSRPPNVEESGFFKLSVAASVVIVLSLSARWKAGGSNPPLRPPENLMNCTNQYKHNEERHKQRQHNTGKIKNLHHHSSFCKDHEQKEAPHYLYAHRETH